MVFDILFNNLKNNRYRDANSFLFYFFICFGNDVKTQ